MRSCALALPPQSLCASGSLKSPVAVTFWQHAWRRSPSIMIFASTTMQTATGRWVHIFQALVAGLCHEPKVPSSYEHLWTNICFAAVCMSTSANLLSYISLNAARFTAEEAGGSLHQGSLPSPIVASTSNTHINASCDASCDTCLADKR